MFLDHVRGSCDREALQSVDTRASEGGRSYLSRQPQGFTWDSSALSTLRRCGSTACITATFPGLKSPRSVSEGVTEPDDWDADDIRSTWIQNVG